ncbi:MAG: type II secretion system protein, partial [Clostridium sp.]|nr:type II secretion system protein [Clostridium sp.]
MEKSKKKKGFTLVELLIVIAITGILMAVAAPKYSGMIERANNIKNQSYAREIVNYVDMHNAEYPNSIINEDDTLDTIVAKESFKVDDDFTEAKEKLSKL